VSKTDATFATTFLKGSNNFHRTSNSNSNSTGCIN